jgi:hypothetical protein
MARSLITPVKTTEMSTATATVTSSVNYITCTTEGAYIKTGGTSNIDATRLLFVLNRNSSKCTTVGYVEILSGSTAGNPDFEPGAYSTGRNLRISIATSPIKSSGVKGRDYYFMIPETARFKDSDGYIKMTFSSELTSAAAVDSSLGAKIACIYLKA